MKLDRRHLRRIINEEASRLGISLNEIMGRESFNQPPTFRWNDFLMRYEVLGAAYTDSGRPIGAPGRNSVRLLSTIYPPRSEVAYVDPTGNPVINKEFVIFKYVAVESDGSMYDIEYLPIKQQAIVLGIDPDDRGGENPLQGIKQVKAAWDKWIDGQPDALQNLEMHDRTPIDAPPKTRTTRATGPARPGRQDIISQMLGAAPPRGVTPAAAPAARPVSSGAAMIKEKVTAIIETANELQDFMDLDDPNVQDALQAFKDAVADYERLFGGR